MNFYGQTAHNCTILIEKYCPGLMVAGGGGLTQDHDAARERNARWEEIARRDAEECRLRALTDPTPARNVRKPGFDYLKAAEMARRGLSQRQIAQRLGVTQGAVCYAIRKVTEGAA